MRDRRAACPVFHEGQTAIRSYGADGGSTRTAPSGRLERRVWFYLAFGRWKVAALGTCTLITFLFINTP
jgi:hypothetical protein